MKLKSNNTQLIPAILDGLQKLLEGQTQFAQAFGMEPERVLPQSYSHLVDCENQINRLDAPEQIQALLNDLMHHQLALLASLDGIAIAALEKTLYQPEIKNPIIRQLTQIIEPLAHKQVVAAIRRSEQRRFHEVIVPGFVPAYCKQREYFYLKEQQTI